MLNKVIEFGEVLDAENIFFFGLSTKDGRESLFRTSGNPYTCSLRGKFIIVDDQLSCAMPNYCYLKLNKAIEKEKVFVIKDADLLTSSKSSKEDIKGKKLISRPEYAIQDTIKYYNAKSKLGEINMLVVKYKMREAGNYQKHTFFDCYLNINGSFVTVEKPNNMIDSSSNSPLDFSTLYFKDFEEIL